MRLFFTQYTPRRIVILLFLLIASSSYSYSQTLQGSATEEGNKKYVQSSTLEPIANPRNKSIRFLKKEKRRMQKLSNILKRRAAGTNASLSELETHIQSKTDHLLDSLAGRIAMLEIVKNQKKVNWRNYYGELKSKAVDHQAIQYFPAVKNLGLKEVEVPKILESMPIKEVEGVQKLVPLKAYTIDSIDIDKVVNGLAQKTTYGQELAKMEGTQNLLTAAQSQLLNNEVTTLPNKEQLQKYAQAKAAKLATSDFATFAPQIKEAQQKFTKYKKKMEWLKEGSGKNANSLKDESFSKRIIYGGNVQMASIAPLSIVAAPFAGYKINKKISAGLSISYKSILGKNTSPIKSFGGEIGYRGFMDYKLIKHWFVHGEFERMSKTVNNTLKDGYDTNWQTNGYVGIGRQIGIIKDVKISAILLCNLAHKDLKSFNPEAFQFRVGISK